LSDLDEDVNGAGWIARDGGIGMQPVRLGVVVMREKVPAGPLAAKTERNVLT